MADPPHRKQLASTRRELGQAYSLLGAGSASPAGVMSIHLPEGRTANPASSLPAGSRRDSCWAKWGRPTGKPTAT